MNLRNCEKDKKNWILFEILLFGSTILIEKFDLKDKRKFHTTVLFFIDLKYCASVNMHFCFKQIFKKF